MFVFVFPFRGLGLVSQTVPQIRNRGPQVGPKEHKMESKTVNLASKWNQNDHCGAKMVHSGLEHDFWRPGIQKDSPKWRSKWFKNRPKNHSKNLLFLEAGSDTIFVDSSPISTPKWCLNGAGWVPKSTQKPLLVEKAGFRSDTGKQRV